MGRPTEFKDEDIIAAGLKLQKAGQNITGFALREIVGGGGPARLKKVWDDYLSGSAKPVQAEPTEILPAEVATHLATAAKALNDQIAIIVSEVNAKAVKAADQRVLEVTSAAQAQKIEHERELNDAAQAVDHLEAQLDASVSEAEQLRAKLASATEQAQERAVELARLGERLALLSSEHAASAQAAQAEIERLRSDLDSKNAESTQAAQQAAQAAQAAQAEIERLRGEMTAHQATAAKLAKREDELEESRKATYAAREESARLTGQLESARAEIKNLSSLFDKRREK